MRDILFVTGMSGAGRSTVLRTLEDLGWEVVDNLPLSLAGTLARHEDGTGQLAIGMSVRTSGFDPAALIGRIEALRGDDHQGAGLLFLDCAGPELERRYAETRRRHPLAGTFPASDGIAREREWLGPLRDWANRLIDTTTLSAHDLAGVVRQTFAGPDEHGLVLSVTSFGFARGIPRDADLVFDMRFLRNPHWVPSLRAGTGLDRDVADYVTQDPVYADAIGRIEELLLLLVPRYRDEGKAYVSIAIGCTGGRHRSVHVAERIVDRLRAEGFSPTIAHRDLSAAPQDSLEGPLVPPMSRDN